MLSASATGLASNFNTSTAVVKLDEGYEKLYLGAGRFISSNNVVVEDVVLVPVNTVFTNNGDMTVLVGNGEKTHRIRFKSGRKGNDYYWAVDGLSEGLSLYFN